MCELSYLSQAVVRKFYLKVFKWRLELAFDARFANELAKKGHRVSGIRGDRALGFRHSAKVHKQHILASVVFL